MASGRTFVLAMALSLAGCDRVFGVEPPDHVLGPALVSSASFYALFSSELTYPMTIPDGPARALVVAVQLGDSCNAPSPEVLGVTYAGMPLQRIAAILGTPCELEATRSEQWLLVEPPAGTGDVLVTLDGEPESVHSGALAFINIDREAPVRAVATTTNTGSTSNATVTSAAGDLVLSTVGHGGGIVGPGGDAMVAYVNNVDASTTLNNAAASTIPGGAPAVTATWMFQGSDEWQAIATSLRPAP